MQWSHVVSSLSRSLFRIQCLQNSTHLLLLLSECSLWLCCHNTGCTPVYHSHKMATSTVPCVDNPTACGDCQTIAQHWPNVSNFTNVEPIYLAQAIIFSVELPVSLVGVILNIIFVCRKKTNFLVRVFVYTSIPTALFLVIFWFVNIPAFNPQQLAGICLYFHDKQFVAMFWISILSLSFCIGMITLVTLYRYRGIPCCPRRQVVRNPSRSRLVCSFILEVLFVVLTVGIPALVSLTMFAFSIGFLEQSVEPRNQILILSPSFWQYSLRM